MSGDPDISDALKNYNDSSMAKSLLDITLRIETTLRLGDKYSIFFLKQL